MSKNDIEREIHWLLEEKYQGVMTDQAGRDIRRLQKGEHIDYVIGFVTFLGCKIDLSFHPLIPRPETESWTNKAIEEMAKQRKKRLHCLDIFAGSGCIGIGVLAHIPEASMDFADLHERYLWGIQANARANHIEPSRYQLFHSDVFSGISRRYDYIFANPPYIAVAKRNEVQHSVLAQEPHGALFAGTDGLDVIRQFLAQAKYHVRKGGRIYMECDSWQGNAIKKILAAHEYPRYEICNDQFGLPRFFVIHC